MFYGGNHVGVKIIMTAFNLKQFLIGVEVEHIQRVLKESGGNKAETGRRLGIKRTALTMRIDRLKRLGHKIDDSRKKKTGARVEPKRKYNQYSKKYATPGYE